VNNLKYNLFGHNQLTEPIKSDYTLTNIGTH